MALIYITGVEGSGKSTVCQELVRRGFDARDMDISIACIHSRETGLPDADIPDYRLRTKEWTDQHSWRIIPDEIIDLARESKGKTIYLCGTADNEEDFLTFFDKVVALHADKATVKQRMLSRKGKNNYGKVAFELDIVFDKYRDIDAKYKRMNAKVIDATQPISKIVGEIVGE